MADINDPGREPENVTIVENNNPEPRGGGGGSTVIIAIVAIVALLAILYFTGVFGDQPVTGDETSVDVDIEAPEVPDVDIDVPEVDTSDLEVGN